MGLRIAILLEKRGMTQKAVAANAGITQASTSKYISGEIEPRADTLANLAIALHTTSDFLLGFTEKSGGLKRLVNELVCLNDDSLARRVRDNSDVQWCLSELQDILAADVVPVRQGEWKWEEEWYDNECIDCGWECSICHVALEDIVGGDWDDRFNPPKLRYCPNCGAKMDR